MLKCDYAVVPDKVEDILSSISTTSNQEEILFNADFPPNPLLSNDPELLPLSRETHQHLDCPQGKRETGGTVTGWWNCVNRQVKYCHQGDESIQE